MFERRHERLVPFSVFAKRVVICFAMSGLLALAALLIGIAGYHWIGSLDWIDSLLNASMILAGMGPVNQLPTRAAKIFASLYALFSGLVFIAVMGIVFSPIVHRMLHKFHIDERDWRR
jgi:hypothetical protein